MRDYGKVAPQFWTGQTGKALKAGGPEAVVVALYLMTSPHANMIGFYYLPTLYLAHETGLGIEGASKGLARAIEAGFCSYDEASEHVLVHAMARFQIGTALKADDKRCKGVQNELDKCPEGALKRFFVSLYGSDYHIPSDPIEAPSKPLASQEQEQEQEQEQKKEPKPRSPTGSRLPADWALPAEWLAWGQQERPELDVPAEGEKFRDFWHGKAGKDGRKLDWLATWRNWIRNARAPYKPTNGRASTGYVPLPGEF